MNKKMICICCPVGCHLDVEHKGKDVEMVCGNKCPRGKNYAIEEIRDPRRMVTAVVKTSSEELPFLPVKSAEAIPRNKVAPLLKKLYSLRLAPPLKCGQSILENLEGTGIDVVATLDCLK